MRTHRIASLLVLALLLATTVAGCLGPGPRKAPPHTLVSRSIDGIPSSTATEVVRLATGSSYRLAARPVTHDPGLGHPIRMFGYNGQIPGPVLRMPQGATVSIEFRNELTIPTTVHWHGVRVAAAFDGVPGQSQPAVEPGAFFTYQVTAPDEGVFLYHPHVREDLQQELGLAGVLVVEGPRAANETWPAERVLVLDDLLVEGDDIAPFWEDTPNRVLMGRYGNRFVVNGDATWEGNAAPGERVRLEIVNAANARPFRLTFPGASRIELIALDGGYLADPVETASVTLAPSERAIVDIAMPLSGGVEIRNSPPGIASAQLGRLLVDGSAPMRIDPGAPAGPHRRAADSLAAAMSNALGAPATTWLLDLQLKEPLPGHAGHGSPPPIEWDVPDDEVNGPTTPDSVRWLILDKATAADLREAVPSYAAGSYVRVVVENPASLEHPMQHPIHLHGQRFIVLTIDGQPTPPQSWKDTVLVPAGTTATILVEMSNPGTWMVHCHISEHLEAGMEGYFTVT